jgi:hypothetical protein
VVKKAADPSARPPRKRRRPSGRGVEAMTGSPGRAGETPVPRAARRYDITWDECRLDSSGTLIAFSRSVVVRSSRRFAAVRGESG